MDDTPLYNSRIFKSYVEYLNRYFPEIDIDPLLKYANIEAYQLEDEGHWLTQEQSDHFNTIIAKKTQDKDISRKVGVIPLPPAPPGRWDNMLRASLNRRRLIPFWKSLTPISAGEPF